MKIRTRLLLLIFPAVVGMVLVVSYLCYITWYKQIVKNYRYSLQAIAISCAQTIDSKDHTWITEHETDPHIKDAELYQKYTRALTNIRELLPISRLYTIVLSPVPRDNLKKSNTINANTENENQKLPEFRQTYILDTEATQKPAHTTGSHEVSQPGVVQIYETKSPFVTAIYEDVTSHDQYITAYAPIIDSSGNVSALVGADLNLEVIDHKAHEIQGLIALSAITTLLFIFGGVVLIAKKISQPVEKLKNAALIIAAGNWGQTIEVDGPQEIMELSNTLNTMSECMQEHVARLEETSLFREKLLGQKECFRILQHKLLDEPIYNFSHPEIRLQSVEFPGKTKQKALYLEILDKQEKHLLCSIKEASKDGFDGAIDLLRTKDTFSKILLTLQKEESGIWKFSYATSGISLPLIWSQHKQNLFIATSEQEVWPQDLILIVNSNLHAVMRHEEEVQHWFRRVFHHFAHEGIEVCMNLLKSEFIYLAQRQRLDSALELICFEIVGAKSQEL